MFKSLDWKITKHSLEVLTTSYFPFYLIVPKTRASLALPYAHFGITKGDKRN
jgi:hypothetical protein